MLKVIYDLFELTNFNYHIHTNKSECASVDMNVPNILSYALNSGLEGIALVDHHHTGKHNILEDLAWLKSEILKCKSSMKVFVGAELSAFGIGKYSDSIEVNRMIDYRLYACNHYHLSFWEHPAAGSPRAYAEHMLEILAALIASGRADCIAHPFVGMYLSERLKDPASVTRAITDRELADTLEMGKNNDVAWELNINALSADRVFARRYWYIGREIGVTFHFATDAHELSKINSKQYMDLLKDIIDEL